VGRKGKQSQRKVGGGTGISEGVHRGPLMKWVKGKGDYTAIEGGSLHRKERGKKDKKGGTRPNCKKRNESCSEKPGGWYKKDNRVGK